MIDAELESFADELSDRLRARADRLVVRPDEPSFWDDAASPVGATSTVRVEPSSRSWIAVAAALLIVLVAVGGSALGRRTTTVETAALDTTVAVERMLAIGAQPSADEMVVWMAVTASESEIAAVATRLDSTDVIDGYRYVDRDATYAEFEEFWVDSPDVIAAVDADELPTSFRVSTSDPLAVVDLVSGLPGVLSSDLEDRAADQSEGETETLGNAEMVAESERLFLLPATGTPLASSFVYTAIDDELTDALTPPIVIGRRTTTGFDQVVSVSLEVEQPGTPDLNDLSDVDEPIVAGDRRLERSFSGWFEALDGERWFVVQSVADVDVVADVVAATTLEGGRLVVDEDALGELEVLATLPSTVATGQVMIQATPGNVDPDESDLSIFSVRAEVDLEQLAVFGTIGRSLEPVEVRGVDGFLIQPGGDHGFLAGPMLVWIEPSGHVVSVTQSFATEPELASIAEGLRIVDRATWEAELSALGGTPIDE